MDNERALQQQVLDAYGNDRTLLVRGGGSKDFYGLPSSGELLDMTSHSGIIDYQPTELVLTARAGTSLKTIETTLADRQQMLGCEPPHFGNSATFGGMIAAGLSGPRRPFAGSVADRILGCRILNGRGEIMTFGGKVMKNVAGYDMSRLISGSLGCLAVILEATFRVSPLPRAERTLRFSVAQVGVTTFINMLVESGCPVSASCHDGQALAVRFSGYEQEIAGLEDVLKGRPDTAGFEAEPRPDYWLDVREQQSAFFNGADDIWRLSLAPNTRIDFPGETMVEWNGALRWAKTDLQPQAVFDALAKVNGSATLFRSADPAQQDSVFQPLPPALLNWHRQLKNTFDPLALFNRGRMYREF